MTGINTVVLLGTVTDRGIAIRPLESGAMQATFTLSVPEETQGGGVFTLWCPIEAYGKALAQAEELEPGDLVAIEGKLKVSSWTDKAGVKQRRLVVLAWTCRRVLAGTPAAVAAV